jgi:hypothetical protein
MTDNGVCNEESHFSIPFVVLLLAVAVPGRGAPAGKNPADRLPVKSREHFQSWALRRGVAPRPFPRTDARRGHDVPPSREATRSAGTPEVRLYRLTRASRRYLLNRTLRNEVFFSHVANGSRPSSFDFQPIALRSKNAD